jgi:hypothetical protein
LSGETPSQGAVTIRVCDTQVTFEETCRATGITRTTVTGCAGVLVVHHASHEPRKVVAMVQQTTVVPIQTEEPARKRLTSLISLVLAVLSLVVALLDVGPLR